jgi:formylglycine-generating enzyme required for sulfatase activity
LIWVREPENGTVSIDGSSRNNAVSLDETSQARDDTTMDNPVAARRYRPILELGRGGMAEVFLAVAQGHAGFNKLVVLKKARADLLSDFDFVSMLLNEARLAARLGHPNIVQTYEVGEDEDGGCFIAMEYLEGQPLNRVRQRKVGAERLPFALHLRILTEVLAGLHYAHELTDFDGTPLGVVHRDVTPHNIFITYQGHVKLVDFGIAKAAGASVETRHGVIKGKVAYMPPEQATAGPVDRRTDIFAVGVMLWEAVTGTRMWKGVTEIVVLSELSKGHIPRLRDVKTSGVEPELERIVERAIAPNPDDRYPTAAAMQADLEAYLDTLAEKTSNREIGRHMSERFHEQRVKIKQMIEAQVSDVRWSAPASSPRPSLPLDLPGPLDASRSSLLSLTFNAEGAPSLGRAGQTMSSITPTPGSRTPMLIAAAAEAASVDSSAVTSVEPESAGATTAARASARDTVGPRRSAWSSGTLTGVVLVVAVAVAVSGYSFFARSSRAKPAGASPMVPPVAPLSSAEVPPPPPARRTTCPEGMVLIPGGRFFMGSDDPGFELWRPAHRVAIDTFCVDTYEVTAADYKACSDVGYCKRPDPIPSYPKATGTSDEQYEKDRAVQAELCNFGKQDRAKHPINCVSWDLADNFCKSRRARLPSEAEWEYAARGADGRKYPWGDEAGDALHMNACGTECNTWERKHALAPSRRMYEVDDGYPGTAPVGSFPSGKTTAGAHDFIGNVWEWTNDWFETYKPGDAQNPTGAPAGNRKAIRGGGYNGGTKLWLDPAFRYHQLATASAPAIGFRCVVSL